MIQDDALVLDATTAPLALTYRHRSLDTKKDEPIQDRVGYNGSKAHTSAPVHDFMIECELEVVSGSGGAVSLIVDGPSSLFTPKKTAARRTTRAVKCFAACCGRRGRC